MGGSRLGGGGCFACTPTESIYYILILIENRRSTLTLKARNFYVIQRKRKTNIYTL
jgi:hypothetical protein